MSTQLPIEIILNFPKIKVRVKSDNFINIYYYIPSIKKQSSMDVTLKSSAGSSK